MYTHGSFNKGITLISLIISIVIFITLLLIINALTGNKVIDSVYQIASRENENQELNDMLQWEVYDNLDTNNIMVLITFSNDEGIEQIIEPEGKVINANGKNHVAIDYITSLEKEEFFEVKLSNGVKGKSRLYMTNDEIVEQLKNKAQEEFEVGRKLYFHNMIFKITQIDQDGNMTMACQTPSGSKTLSGKDGYDNCVSYLNSACLELMGGDTRVLTVRSANNTDYDSGVIPRTNNTVYWLASTTYGGWQMHVGSMHEYRVYMVNQSGRNYVTTQSAKRGTTSNFTNNYSYTYALCPIITVNKDIANDVIGIRDHMFYIN